MWKEFKAFALRGNLVDLAVAFVIALFFAAIVTSLVNDVVLPLIAAIFGQPNFASLTATVGKGVIRYGLTLQAAINFVLVVFVLFFVVRGANRLMPPPPLAETRECPFCLTAVPVAATRCPGCTSSLEAAKTS